MNSLPQMANAQVFVPPTLNDQFLTTVFSGGPDDVTINCDMLMQRQELSPIKAVVWDEGCQSNRGHVYFEDPDGRQVFLQFNGVHPDIVLGDSKRSPGMNYRAAVVYIARLGAKYLPALDFYDLRNVGTPAFSANLTGSLLLSPTDVGPMSNTGNIPHIDMWSDPANPVNGYPGMYEFAVTWEETNDIRYNLGDINGGGLYYPSGLPVNFSFTYRRFTDVACYTVLGTGRRMAAFSYLEGWNMIVREIDITGSIPPATFTFFTGPNTLFPRIEAMNQYNSGYLGTTWQAVVSHANSCWVYNNIIPPLPALPGTDISSALLLGGNFKSTAIAAGVGNIPNNAIGNKQYTAGYFEWNNLVAPPRYYARAVDATTGNVLDPNYYIINSGIVHGSTSGYGSADASKSLALSNTSNAGDYLLSVWYDGQDINGIGNIWYKLIGNNTPMQFKTTAVANLDGSAAVRLYPNPARDELFTENAAGDFKIYNLAGMSVAEGHLDTGESIDIKMLPAGTYLLHIGNRMHKFTKL